MAPRTMVAKIGGMGLMIVNGLASIAASLQTDSRLLTKKTMGGLMKKAVKLRLLCHLLKVAITVPILIPRQKCTAYLPKHDVGQTAMERYMEIRT